MARNRLQTASQIAGEDSAPKVRRNGNPSPPLKVIDRRSAFGYRSDDLYRASRRQRGRPYQPGLDDSTHRHISTLGRRELLTWGRTLYANYPAVGAAVREQAELAVSTWIPQFAGADQDWGEEAAAWLIQWENIMDVSGCVDGYCLRKSIITQTLTDGELAIILTQTENEYPQIQVLRSHQIGDPNSEPLPDLVDGVFVSSTRRPLAFQLNPGSVTDSRDRIPSSSCILVFDPDYPDQVRGISRVGTAAFLWDDLALSQQYEMTAQKSAASIALLEHNEEGGPDDEALAYFGQNQGGTNEGAPYYEQMLDGAVRYFRAGSGAKLEAFKHDRPSANVQNFISHVERQAFRSIDWDWFYTLNPSQVGGASMRVIVDKLVRTIQSRQRLVARTMRRIHSYALARAIRIGLLPGNDEWWQWTYQGPALPTADAKYQSDVSLNEIGGGLSSFKIEAGKRGARWQDLQDQRILEAVRMAERVVEETGFVVSPLTFLMPEKPQPAQAPPQEDQDDDPGEKEKSDDTQDER